MPRSGRKRPSVDTNEDSLASAAAGGLPADVAADAKEREFWEQFSTPLLAAWLYEACSNSDDRPQALRPPKGGMSGEEMPKDPANREAVVSTLVRYRVQRPKPEGKGKGKAAIAKTLQALWRAINPTAGPAPPGLHVPRCAAGAQPPGVSGGGRGGGRGARRGGGPTHSGGGNPRRRSRTQAPAASRQADCPSRAARPRLRPPPPRRPPAAAAPARSQPRAARARLWRCDHCGRRGDLPFNDPQNLHLKS